VTVYPSCHLAGDIEVREFVSPFTFVSTPPFCSAAWIDEDGLFAASNTYFLNRL